MAVLWAVSTSWENAHCISSMRSAETPQNTAILADISLIQALLTMEQSPFIYLHTYLWFI
jgi:hypothetical protein